MIGVEILASEHVVTKYGLSGTSTCTMLAVFIIALIITGIWKGQLKSVVSKTRADDYIRCGSLNITTSRELYLYRHIDRRAKPQNTSSGSSGRSSSGRSYSGRGGKF